MNTVSQLNQKYIHIHTEIPDFWDSKFNMVEYTV